MPYVNRARRKPAPSTTILTAALCLTALGMSGVSAAEVNLYTHRQPQLISPLLERFTAETGIKVNVLFAQNGLAERIQSEGERSPADMLLTVDIATLQHAVSLGIAQPVRSPVLEAAIPAHLRAGDGSWHAASMRARVIYAAKDRVKDETLTYESLGEPRFKGRFCTRSGQHDYNVALIGAAIGHLGAERAEAWLRALRTNLAKKPSGGDRDVAKDIAAGTCDVGLGNTYYVGLMQADANQKAWAEAIRVIMPTFQNGGTHVNVSGFIITKAAKNRAEAIKLAEFLVSSPAQAFYARQNFEYPVVGGVPTEKLLESFGDLKADRLSLDIIAQNRKAASQLVEKVGFDLGPF